MPPILEARNLVKHYGNFAAVKGISFHIDAGEIFSLLGPTGAGKSDHHLGACSHSSLLQTAWR